MTSRMEKYIICTTCLASKHCYNFGKYKTRNKINFRKSCKSCRVKQQQLRYASSPEMVIKAKVSARKSILKNIYGINEDDFSAMLKKQGNKCKICNSFFTKKPNIDHCHSTNKVRGLLCWNCNIGIGYFKESTNSLMRAVEYLTG